MNRLINAYKSLPTGAKNALKYGYGLIPLRMRLGKKFFEQLEFLEKSQWWSEAELENYQNEQLRKLIRHACENVPYYYNLFKANKLAPGDIATIKDLPKIPILTKDIVRNNLDLLKAKNFKNSDVVKLSTSGTTGKPVSFYYDKDKEYLNFDPYIWRFFGWADHRIGEPHATISCWTTSNQLFTHNPARNLLILSAYKINKENAKHYAEIMKKYNAKYLDTYPSAIELLTSFLRDEGIEPPVKLSAVFTHSECLYDWQRKTIEEYWSCKCFDWYGMEERVILGIECEKHNGLHLCPDFAITEIIDDEEIKLKRIISTSLTNYAMPFIRYGTEDVGMLSGRKCLCQRKFPLLTLKGGREKSFAIGKDDSYIPVVNVDIPNVTDNVLQFQFTQEIKGKLSLCLIKKSTFKDDDLEKIKTKIDEKFGMNMDVCIEFRDVIQQTNNKKTPIFIQKIKEKEICSGTAN